MAISNADWQAIWNEGYQVGWNDRYKQNHAVTHAPSNTALCISKANWDAVYNAGFDDAYGKKVSAPAPADIPHDDAVCPPVAVVSTTNEPVATPARAIPTIYGVPMNSENMQIANAMLNVGLSLGAHSFLLEAIIYAAMGESNITSEIDNGGPLQTTCNLAAYNGGRDVAAQARGWFSGGECFGSGGGFAYSKVYSQVWQVANAVEENAKWAASREDSYARNFGTAALEAEASYIVSYLLPGLGTVIPSTSQAAPTIQSPTSAILALNWAGDYELAWQDAVGGAKAAVANMKQYNDRLVAYDFVEPATFSRKA